VADAPAKSFLKSVKNHNAYYGCERCYCKGIWKKSVIFDNGKYDSYNDNIFKNLIYKKHHNGLTPLIELKLGLISQIPLDYLHLFFLGVMKRLLLVWTKGKHKLSNKDINEMSTRMISLRKFVPSNCKGKMVK
jgi:hypothetical protein